MMLIQGEWVGLLKFGKTFVQPHNKKQIQRPDNRSKRTIQILECTKKRSPKYPISPVIWPLRKFRTYSEASRIVHLLFDVL